MKQLNAPVRFSVLLMALMFVSLAGCVFSEPGWYIVFVDDNIGLAGETGNQQAPACAYASGTNEYFVVWEDSGSGFDRDICGRMFTYRAGAASDAIPVCIASGDQMSARVAYNSTDEEYLVVWEDYATGDSDIQGRLVSALTGELIGARLAISRVADTDERAPQVTYNPDANNYLVTWDEDTGTDRDIVGIIVQADGSVGTGAFVITPTAGNQQSAVVAYDTILGRHLVVFMDFADSALEGDIYGQFVASDGGLDGIEFPINLDSGDQQFPSIAFNPDYHRFLVVWEDNYFGDWDVCGQEVLAASGSLLDDPFCITPPGSNQRNPTIACNYSSGDYLVVWEDGRYGTIDIFGQALSSKVQFLGCDTLINEDPLTSIMPAVCPNTYEGEFLVAWSAPYYGDYDILGQIVY